MEITRTARPSSSLRTLPSKDLLGHQGLVRIAHQGEIYVLRLTRNGRLILTK